MYLLDSFALLEYFMGTKRGATAKAVIESPVPCVIPSICVSEVYEKSLRTDGPTKAEERLEFIKGRCAIIELDEKLAVEAAKINFEMKKNVEGWGLADSIVLATARRKDAKILTGDRHFSGLKESAMI